jgi:hypothetical protein
MSTCTRAIGPGLMLLGLLLVLPAFAPAQESKVYKNVTADKLEGVLSDLNITYKKTPGGKNGVFFYEFTRNGFKVKLHNYDGQDLWIESTFTDRLTLDDVNRWNVRAKFSRAVMVGANGKTSVVLENQFDCLGGATDAVVRQFVVRFDGELTTFAKFISR